MNPIEKGGINDRSRVADLESGAVHLKVTMCDITVFLRSLDSFFFSFQNNPKDLDPSYKMDLDLWGCLGRVKLVL